MNYEEKYKEALERAKDLHDNHPYGEPGNWWTCEQIFPELKESEDEKIRKKLISFVKNWDKDGIISKYTSNANDIEQILAWLEKQCEQKPSWSKEDEEQLDRAIYMMGQLGLTKSWDDVYNWLKSLKERV